MCRGKERTHMHHIVPKYMGGTDAKENLVEVTVTQHSMFHFCNYQLWKNDEDRIAWLALSGQISFDDAKIEAVKMGATRGKEKFVQLCKNKEYKENLISRCKESFQKSPHKDRIINQLKDNQSKAVEASKSPKSREKQKQSLRKINHQKGKNNSQYGKMWITNGTKEGTYRINKGESIPEGYRKGRICYDVKPKGKTSSAYGRIWINNGGKNKMIPKCQPIPDGYVKGRYT